MATFTRTTCLAVGLIAALSIFFGACCSGEVEDPCSVPASEDNLTDQERYERCSWKYGEDDEYDGDVVSKSYTVLEQTEPEPENGDVSDLPDSLRDRDLMEPEPPGDTIPELKAEKEKLEKLLKDSGVEAQKFIDPNTIVDRNPYWCSLLEEDVIELISVCLDLGDLECANRWRIQLGWVYEARLAGCDEYYFIWKYAEAYELYTMANSKARAERAAEKEADRHKREFINGGDFVDREDFNGRFIGTFQSPPPGQQESLRQASIWYERAGYPEEKVRQFVLDACTEAEADCSESPYVPQSIH
ncbi:hypothetical protein KKC88_04205 [Patescibacteria group bacterium]|nr:hypothetical protein [Patescibacteria group bacterium]MBU1673804.1 hypothetical protein [Patescibacteria group bacterium]MBU1963774.1 hypothetical protein [Patescibacteria group bacterium]